MTRVAPLDEDGLDPQARAIFESFKSENRRPIELYRILANTPTLLPGFHEIGQAIRYRTTLQKDLVELVILRVAQLTDSSYEWLHHLRFARAAGVEEGKIASLGTWKTTNQIYTDAERAALHAADEIHLIALSDEGFAELSEHYGVREVVELVGVISHYESVSRVLQALGVTIEPEYLE